MNFTIKFLLGCFFYILLPCYAQEQPSVESEANNRIIPRLALQIKNNSIKDAFFSKTGEQFITQTENMIFIWDSKSGSILDFIPKDLPGFKKTVAENSLMKLFSYKVIEQENNNEDANDGVGKTYNLIKRKDSPIYYLEEPNSESAYIANSNHFYIKNSNQEIIGEIKGVFNIHIGDFLDGYGFHDDLLYIWDSCHNANMFNHVRIKNNTIGANDIYGACSKHAEISDFNAGVLIGIDLKSGGLIRNFDLKTGIRGVDFISDEKIIFENNQGSRIVLSLHNNSMSDLKVWFNKYARKLNDNAYTGKLDGNAVDDYYYTRMDEFKLVDIDQNGKHALFKIDPDMGSTMAVHSSMLPFNLFDGLPIIALDLEEMSPPPKKREALNTKILMRCPNNQLILKVFSSEYDSLYSKSSGSSIDERDKHEGYFLLDINNPLGVNRVFNENIRVFAISPDCESFFGKSSEGSIGFFSLKDQKPLKKFPYEFNTNSTIYATYSYQGDKLAIHISDSSNAETYLIETKEYSELASIKTKAEKWRQDITTTSINFSQDGNYLQACQGQLGVNIFDTRDKLDPLKKITPLNSTSYCSMGGVSSMGVYVSKSQRNNSDSTKYRIINSLVDINTGNTKAEWTGDEKIRMSIFTSDSRKLIIDAVSAIEIRDADSGILLQNLENKDGIVKSMFLSVDDKFLITTHENGVLVFWDLHASNQHLLARIALDKNNWLITTPDGRFDTNNLDSIPQAHWIMPDDPLTPLPPEVFMRDYYEPNLLQRILACTRADWDKPGDGACQAEFPPLKALADLNRAQPEVKIAAVQPDATQPGRVSVTVKVKQTQRSVGEGVIKHWDSRVCDVRLFRDDQIVVSQGAEQVSEGINNTDTELEAWRSSNCLKNLDGSGEATLTFSGIRLPQRDDTKEITFSAYAFNEDRVKSETATETCQVSTQPQPNAQGCQLSLSPQPHPRRAYIVTIGVEHFEYEKWDLNFAADDARDLSKKLVEHIGQTNEFSPANVIPIVLESEKDTKTGIIKNAATKANIHNVFRMLAGQTLDEASQEALKIAIKEDAFNQLQAATPDDLVLIAYSSHGYADAKGNFYLFPYDIGQTGFAGLVEGVAATVAGTPLGNNVPLEDFLKRTISSEELSQWLRGVDAGELALIVDACYSAAGINQPGFKPAPMGSRGLGQLAYDKRMRVLTAAREDSPAYEINGNGVLTAALVKDGLADKPMADFEPQDQRIELGEWLRYGVKRVPELLSEPGKAKDPTLGVSKQDDTQGKSVQQQPALFDFRRMHMVDGDDELIAIHK